MKHGQEPLLSVLLYTENHALDTWFSVYNKDPGHYGLDPFL